MKWIEFVTKLLELAVAVTQLTVVLVLLYIGARILLFTK